MMAADAHLFSVTLLSLTKQSDRHSRLLAERLPLCSTHVNKHDFICHIEHSHINQQDIYIENKRNTEKPGMEKTVHSIRNCGYTQSEIH
jgi:hypothetical protein